MDMKELLEDIKKEFPDQKERLEVLCGVSSIMNNMFETPEVGDKLSLIHLCFNMGCCEKQLHFFQHDTIDETGNIIGSNIEVAWCDVCNTEYTVRKIDGGNYEVIENIVNSD